MFGDFTPKAITVYWLSGFDQSRFETWEAKRASIAATENSLSFEAYLAWPLEEAEECRIVIKRQENGLVLRTDWFPEEEFPLKEFVSEDGGEIILRGAFARETVFIHLQA
jgi:hypothetical protein